LAVPAPFRAKMFAVSQPSSWTKEISLMLKTCLKAREALKRLRADRHGVVSFEYVTVAACIVAATSAVFGGAGVGTVQGALASGIGAITNTIAGA
jgi:pilus assembly protein Flp/PilA